MQSGRTIRQVAGSGLGRTAFLPGVKGSAFSHTRRPAPARQLKSRTGLPVGKSANPVSAHRTAAFHPADPIPANRGGIFGPEDLIPPDGNAIFGSEDHILPDRIAIFGPADPILPDEIASFGPEDRIPPSRIETFGHTGFMLLPQNQCFINFKPFFAGQHTKLNTKH